MTSPAGVLTLRRPHTADASPLRAWSAADEMLLNELGAADTAALGRVLIVNDEFGALSCGLAVADPVIWSDSALSRSAVKTNFEANSLDPAATRFVRGDEQPEGPFDTVVVKVPKTTALLEYQLLVAASIAAPGARIVGTGMARHIHRSTVASFERCIGPTVTTRAVRKARLIHSELVHRGEAPALEPTYFTTSTGLRIAELPGTFSDGRIDAGSALLLDHLLTGAAPQPGAAIADLGCGNGVLAASLARKWSECGYQLRDVSDLAVAAAEHTWQANDLDAEVHFDVADSLAGVASDSIDLMICNPPFHQGHAVDAGLTARLLIDAARALKPGGTAVVVGQRDLNLHAKMPRWFSSVEVVSKHPNYVVLVATR